MNTTSPQCLRGAETFTIHLSRENTELTKIGNLTQLPWGKGTRGTCRRKEKTNSASVRRRKNIRPEWRIRRPEGRGGRVLLGGPKIPLLSTWRRDPTSSLKQATGAPLREEKRTGADEIEEIAQVRKKKLGTKGPKGD